MGEIEQKIFAISGVKETVVLVDDPLQATVLHAFIACDGESQSNLTDATFKKELAKSLPSYMVPDVFHFYRVLPKSTSGKIDRKTLSMSMNEKETSAFATNDEITAKIASMWAEILNRPVTSIHENFFEAGGHSLKATRLLSRIHRDLDVKIELRDIFLNPVLQDIVEIVKKAGQVSSHRRIPRASYSAHYELSNAQKRLWVLSQFDGGLQAYSEEGAVRFERAVDPVLLQRAVNQLIERHEILRTSFVVIDGEPRQKINRFQKELYKIQLCEFGEKAFHAEDLLTILSTAGGPFDLAKGPLIRFALADTHTNGWVFAFSVHHIICDGWSGRVFLRDIISLYLDYERGAGASLRKLAIQFKDYAVWQKKLLRDSQTEVSRQFWTKKLG
ncbi:MAG: condensation domain-containing protein, partial [Flammeovirgaceae bacterium]